MKIFAFVYQILLDLQIIKHLWRILGQLTQYTAGTHLLAVSTGIVSFLQYAFADFAHVTAIKGLTPFCTATHAINPFRLKFHLVHLSPFFCHFLSQTIIVVQSG